MLPPVLSPTIINYNSSSSLDEGEEIALALSRKKRVSPPPANGSSTRLLLPANFIEQPAAPELNLLRVAAARNVIGKDFDCSRPRVAMSRLGKLKSPEPAAFPKKDREYLSTNQSLEGNRM